MADRDISRPALIVTSLPIHAASINPLDWHRIRGLPYVLRASEGLAKPKNNGLGADVAGRVTAVGRNVTQVQPDDEVFGMSIRTCAEYVRVSEHGIVHKPANLTFEHAAAVPAAASTALQGLRDKGEIQAGQRVLINGAAGGVGTFAVQIAKSFGADHVIDYTQADFTHSGQRYDLILDAVGNRSLSDTRRVLGSDGILVLAAAAEGRWLGPLIHPLKAVLISRFVGQKLVPFLAKRSKADLIFLKELIEAGKVTPVIDRQYPLTETPTLSAIWKEDTPKDKSSSGCEPPGGSRKRRPRCRRRPRLGRLHW